MDESECHPQGEQADLNLDQSELATSAQSLRLQQMLVLASSPEVPPLPPREVNLSMSIRENDSLPVSASR
jgi:hypothetical protein